jgi:hypothetical protein
MQCYNGVWIGIIFLLRITEFINTKDPESDSASNTKVQTEPVTKTNKIEANIENMSPAKVQGMALHSSGVQKGTKY